MKLATGLIGIFLSLIVMVQACAIYAGGSLASNQSFGEAGAVGVMVGVLLFLGGAFAFGLPLVACVIFTLGGLLAMAISGTFADMWIWGLVSFGLATMALFAWRSASKARKARQQAGAAS